MPNYPDPAIISASYAQADSADRRQLMAAWLPEMADSLGGITAICALAFIDPVSFEFSLKSEIESNPKNITALRTLIWFLLRCERFGEARDVFSILSKHWPHHHDAFVEHLRLLILIKSPDQEYFLADNANQFRTQLTQKSYQLQTLVSMGRTQAIQDSKHDFIRTARSLLLDLLNQFSFQAETPEEQSDVSLLQQVAGALSVAKSVAIIGNGPSIKGAGYGPQIDTYPFVIRCNFPQIEGHEADVGSRTDLVLFTESLGQKVRSLVGRHQSFQTAIKLAVHTQRNTSRIISIEEQEERIKWGQVPLVAQDMISNIAYTRATTGLVSIIFAAILFGKKIDLYGFDFFKKEDDAHYYEKQTGFFIGHETHYERWFTTEFLPSVLDESVTVF